MQILQTIVVALALVPVIACFLIWKHERDAIAEQAEIERLDDLFNIR